MFLSREMGKGHGEATHHETQYLSTQSTYFFTILKCFYSYFMCVLPAYVSTKYIHWGSLELGFRWLWVTTWVLEIKPQSSGKAPGVLNCWVILPAPIKKKVFVYVCVCHVYVFACAHVRTWQAEALCGHQAFLPVTLHLINWSRISHWAWTSLSPSAECWNYRHVPTHSASVCFLNNNDLFRDRIWLYSSRWFETSNPFDYAC